MILKVCKIGRRNGGGEEKISREGFCSLGFYYCSVEYIESEAGK
jgi:hypothetical protein